MIVGSRTLAILFTVFLLSACKEPFQPLRQPDRPFSMYGLLDLTADTQWIRVMPVRASIFTGSEPIDAMVTMEHLGTGRIVELRDSIIRYKPTDSDISDDRWAHNFWTTEPVEPEARYRIEVQRSDGAAASAVVEMPPEPERIVVELAQPGAGRFLGDYVKVEGVKHLAMVHVRRFPPEGCDLDIPYVDFHQPNSAISDEEGAPRVAVSLRTLGGVCGPASGNWSDLNIVVSGSRWPFDAAVAPGVYQHADVASNVEGGIGFIGGILPLQFPMSSASPRRARPFGPTARSFMTGDRCPFRVPLWTSGARGNHCAQW